MAEGDRAAQLDDRSAPPCLPEGPHKLSRVEVMAGGALLGMGKAITGKGYEEIVRAMVIFDRSRSTTPKA